MNHISNLAKFYCRVSFVRQYSYLHVHVYIMWIKVNENAIDLRHVMYKNK